MMFPAFIGLPSGGEMFLIVGVLVLLFGGRKLPELARAMGSSINQFKRGLKEEADQNDKLGAPKDGDTKEQ